MHEILLRAYFHSFLLPPNPSTATVYDLVISLLIYNKWTLAWWGHSDLFGIFPGRVIRGGGSQQQQQHQWSVHFKWDGVEVMQYMMSSVMSTVSVLTLLGQGVAPCLWCLKPPCAIFNEVLPGNRKHICMFLEKVLQSEYFTVCRHGVSAGKSQQGCLGVYSHFYFGEKCFAQFLIFKFKYMPNRSLE